MAPLTPFKIAVPNDKLERLQQELALTDFPDDITDANDPWSRGAPLADIKRLDLYWKNEFDWRKAEAKPSTVLNAIPLLFLHGWPGSFIEVTRMLLQLVMGGKEFPAFHVVAPSLIDFGFSDASEKTGFSIWTIIQGGDLGSLVARFVALKYGPEHCKAYHVNSAVPSEPTTTSHPELYAKIQVTPLTESEIAGLGRTAQFGKEGNGYFQQQSTKPQTIGYSLTDSPIGLLSWLYEKIHDWSDDCANSWTDDEILTWVSIYYFSKAGPGARSKIYYENEHRQPGAFAASQVYIDVPLGVARFAKDLILLPKLWNRTLGPVVFKSEYEDGGHFAAWERPNAVMGD